MTQAFMRKLNPQTIIPSSLYVRRDADRQLKSIVDGMGRPGYVLVARQMGKTNLLLNAKREMENGPDCFVYIDVSNTVPKLVDFFRYVIDQTIDGYPERFEEIGKKIRAARAPYPELPHKEHEQELRLLLRAITGRLVICLGSIVKARI